MTILTYPATPVPLISAEWQEEYGDIHSPFGENPGGRTFTNSLRRFPLKTFPFPYLASNADRNTIRAFIANARRQGNRFWCFWPSFLACYDQFVGVAGPWSLTGCMVYDASAATYTDETDDANNATVGDVSVHPVASAGAEVDSLTILADHKFNYVSVTIATPGVGTYTISGWQYSKNDGTWASLTVTDNTTSFKAAAGERTVTFTIPTNWDTVMVNNALGYGIKALFDIGTVTTAPLVTLITVNCKTFDLPGSGLASGTTIVYVNGVVKTGGGTDYTFGTGGGGGGSDRIVFTNYQTQGDLVTCDYVGLCRILGYLPDNAFKELFPTGGMNLLHSFFLTVKEDRR